jgi:3-deoxy-D-manno-octulosonic-acid transferase
MELEVWPNFISQCRKRNIPVLLVNGRLTAASFSRYSWARPLVRGMFSRLNWVCAQDQTYAERFVALGVDKDRIAVTGTMKFDTAQIAGNVPGDLLLADQVGLVPGKDLIWVCGSTGPGEEQLILAQYRQLLTRYSRLRLVLVPRKPERFDEVADLIRSMKFSVVRRSRKTIPPPGPLPHVVLGDTMGELRKFYSIADVVFVGRTMVDLGARQHGSDMIEPAALAKPIIVGPFTGNFAEPMARFTAAEAIHVVADAAELGQAIAGVLSTPYQSRTMAERAQDTVRRGQGATTRNVRCILDYLGELAPAPKHPEHAPVRLDIVAEPAAIVTMAPTPAPERPKTHAAAEAPAKPVYMSINAANDGGQ